MAPGGLTIRAFIARCILGVFAFDEDEGLVDHISFTGSPAEVKRRMAAADGDEAALAKRLAEKGYDVVTEARVSGFENDPDNLARRVLAQRMADIAIELELHPTREAVQALLRDVALLMAADDLARLEGGKEMGAAQAVRALDDLDRAIDRLGQRLREWFLAERPSYEDRLPGPGGGAGGEEGDTRYPWTVSALHRDNLGLMMKAIGGKDGEGLPAPLGQLARRLEDLFGERDALEGFIDDTMKEAAPNLYEVAGPTLAARLVAEAGSLDRLAKMPSTTIQILGAKRAVFRHIRSGDRPPKHGLIFVHPAVAGARRWQRGKISKALAAIISRAARADAFGEIIAGHHLRKELDAKVEKIRERMLEPPERPAPSAPAGTGRGMGMGKGGGKDRGRGRGKGRRGKGSVERRKKRFKAIKRSRKRERLELKRRRKGGG